MTDKPTHADRRAETMRAMKDWLKGQKPKHAGPPKPAKPKTKDQP